MFADKSTGRKWSKTKFFHFVIQFDERIIIISVVIYHS